MVKGSMVYSYTQLEQLIKNSRDGQTAKLAHNTTEHFVDTDRIGIWLYYTDVIIINPDDSYALHSKGYATRTTQDRLNSFSPARVITKDFSFYVLRDPTGRALKNNLIPFYEGITVDRFGNVSSVTA
jgi:hypothetical protein